MVGGGRRSPPPNKGSRNDGGGGHGSKKGGKGNASGSFQGLAASLERALRSGRSGGSDPSWAVYDEELKRRLEEARADKSSLFTAKEVPFHGSKAHEKGGFHDALRQFSSNRVPSNGDCAGARPVLTEGSKSTTSIEPLVVEETANATLPGATQEETDRRNSGSYLGATGSKLNSDALPFVPLATEESMEELLEEEEEFVPECYKYAEDLSGAQGRHGKSAVQSEGMLVDSTSNPIAAVTGVIQGSHRGAGTLLHSVGPNNLPLGYGKSSPQVCTQGIRHNASTNCNSWAVQVEALDVQMADGSIQQNVTKELPHPNGEANSKPLPKPGDGAAWTGTPNCWTVAAPLSKSAPSMEKLTQLNKKDLLDEDGTSLVLNFEEVNASIAKLNCALVGKLLGRKIPYDYMFNELRKKWGQYGLLNFIPSGQSCFICVFQNVEARDSVLMGSPWTVASHIIGMDKWSPAFSPTTMNGLSSPIWVRLPELPLIYWSQNNISRIGSMIGEPLWVDHQTTSWSRGAYARLCVRVNLAEKLLPGIWIKGVHGRFFQKLEYEGVHAICFGCGHIGHKDVNCPTRPSSARGLQAMSSADGEPAHRPQNTAASNVFAPTSRSPQVEGESSKAQDEEGLFGAWMVVTRKKKNFRNKTQGAPRKMERNPQQRRHFAAPNSSKAINSSAVLAGSQGHGTNEKGKTSHQSFTMEEIQAQTAHIKDKLNDKPEPKQLTKPDVPHLPDRLLKPSFDGSIVDLSLSDALPVGSPIVECALVDGVSSPTFMGSPNVVDVTSQPIVGNISIDLPLDTHSAPDIAPLAVFNSRPDVHQRVIVLPLGVSAKEVSFVDGCLTDCVSTPTRVSKSYAGVFGPDLPFSSGDEFFGLERNFKPRKHFDCNEQFYSASRRNPS